MAGFIVSTAAPRWAGILSFCLLVGCGAAPTLSSSDQAAESYSVEPSGGAVSGDQEAAAPTAPGDAVAQLANTATVPQQAPRLVKRASLTVKTADLETAIAAVEELLTQQQGDILQLSDAGTAAANQARQVQIELRVPEANLSSTLAALKDLGTVQQQSLTAEDVSNQLVDLQARVRNLRQSETALLAIMERSGSIAEVLEVSRELSTVREAIERTDAQVQNLRNQVAFSTISLTLATATSPVPLTDPVSETLAHTWQAATHSMGTVSLGLLRLGLWLLAYSPYWGGILLIALGFRRWRQRPSTTASTPPAQQ